MEKLADSLLSVTIPKQLVIKNTRLGMLNLCLQLLALLYVLATVFITRPWFQSHEPDMNVFSMWATRGSTAANEDLKYCTSPQSYTYFWSDQFQYEPTKCEEKGMADSAAKSGTSHMFVATYAQDTFSWQSDECNQQAAQDCQSSGGQYNVTGSSCRCVRTDQYFFKDPESIILNVIHGYKVNYEDTFLNPQILQDAAVSTTFQNEAGSPCTIGGRREWDGKSLVAGISAPLQDFFSCAGLDLDEESDALRSFDSGELYSPTPRIAGASLNLEFKYGNIVDFAETAQDFCKVTISAAPQWTSQQKDTMLQVPFPVPSGDRTTRHQYSYGVSVQAVKGGSMRFFSISLFLRALIDMVVVASLPAFIIRFIALRMVGLLSNVYKASACEVLSIRKKLIGVCGRMSVYAAAYRTITHQVGSTGRQLRGIDHIELGLMLKDIFASEEGASGVLDDKELEMLARFMIKRVDTTGTGTFSYDNFVRTCSQQEPMDMSLIARLFDMDRKPSFLERLLSEKPVFVRGAHPLRSETSLIDMDDGPAIPTNPVAIEERLDQLHEQEDELEQKLEEAEETQEVEYSELRKQISDRNAYFEEQLAGLQANFEELKAKLSSQFEVQARLVSSQFEQQAGLISSQLEQQAGKFSQLASELKAGNEPAASSTWFSDLFQTQGERQDFQQARIQFEALEARLQARVQALELQIPLGAGGNERWEGKDAASSSLDNNLLPVGLENLVEKVNSVSGRVDSVCNKVADCVIDLTELKGRFRYLDASVGDLSDAFRSANREHSQLATFHTPLTRLIAMPNLNTSQTHLSSISRTNQPSTVSDTVNASMEPLAGAYV